MPKNAYIKDFLKNLEHRKYSSQTLASYRQSLKRFFNFSAKERVKCKDVDCRMLERYVLNLKSSALSQNTISLYLRSVRSLFTFLEEQNLIFENPFLLFVMPEGERRLGDVLTESEVKKILAAPDPADVFGLRDRALLELLYATGMRRSELINLSIFDVDLDQQLVEVFGKGRKKRLLPIGKHAVKYLAAYLRHARPKLVKSKRPGDWLWLNNKGEALRSRHYPSLIIRKYASKADVSRKMTPHTFRRSCATHMLNRGAHPMMVAEMLGHANLGILRQYLNISITELMKTHAKTRPGK